MAHSKGKTKICEYMTPYAIEWTTEIVYNEMDNLKPALHVDSPVAAVSSEFIQTWTMDNVVATR